MVDDGQKKSRMGRKPERSITHERDKAGSINQDIEDDASKSSEPYVCTGNFHLDFRRLCTRNQMTEIPEVKQRPHRPQSPPPPPVLEEKTKPGKGGKDKNQPPPPPEPEPELPLINENGEPAEPPPKTFATKDKFEYFRPCIQVETEHVDKQDLVTEIYIRGWKTDVSMMNTLGQCWPALSKLQSISLWNTGLDDETLRMLSSVVSSCTNLRTLILDSNPVKSEAWHLLITESSSVQNLSLRYCDITDFGAENLGRVLGTSEKQNQKLISLDLTGNKITDKGAEYLANGLRTNRTLLVLGLGGNLIGDAGAAKLAEVISRFQLTHEEIVERRKLLSSTTDRKILTPVPSSRKGDGHDRPGSVRSQVSSQAAGSKGKAGKTGKKSDQKSGKDEDGKHEKTKGAKTKETEKITKKAGSSWKLATNVAESSKSTSKKTPNKKRPTIIAIEQEIPEAVENHNPLLEHVEHIGNGVILLQGNFTLISLNLSNNKIGEKGICAFVKALQYQTTLSQFPTSKAAAEETVTTTTKNAKEKESISTPAVQHNRFQATGLMRLCLKRNELPADNEDMKLLHTLMSTKDPLLKLSDSGQDQK